MAPKTGRKTKAAQGGDSINPADPSVKREGGAVVIDASAIMARLDDMEKKVAAAEDRAASAEAQAIALQGQLSSAQENGFFIDEFGCGVTAAIVNDEDLVRCAESGERFVRFTNRLADAVFLVKCGEDE